MKTKTTPIFTSLLLGTVALFATTGFSQSSTSSSNTITTPVEAASSANTPTAATPPATSGSPSKTPTASLSSLTPEEREELSKAHQQALQDPAVQSTRQIARMALHKAMLAIDPSIETIFANMNANGPKDKVAVHSEEKALGDHYDKWAGNIPPSSQAVLTPEDRTKLRAAHDQAMKDLAVIAARKTARVTLYNAMINANPTIGAILTKAGIKAPSNVESSVKNSAIGSEEKILGGGNGQQWSKEVLDPAIKKENQEASTASNATPAPTNNSSATTNEEIPVPTASVAPTNSEAAPAASSPMP